MPISKENKTLYLPLKERTALRAKILERADHKCERCGVREYAIVTHLEGGGRLESQDPFPSYKAARSHLLELRESGYELALRSFVVTLAIAHLDHDPRDSREDVVAALCQRCHLTEDKYQHRANMIQTRARKKREQEGGIDGKHSGDYVPLF